MTFYQWKMMSMYLQKIISKKTKNVLKVTDDNSRILIRIQLTDVWICGSGSELKFHRSAALAGCLRKAVHLEEHHELRPWALDAVRMELAVKVKVRVSHLALHLSERGKQLLLLVQPKQRKLISMNYGQMALSFFNQDPQNELWPVQVFRIRINS